MRVNLLRVIFLTGALFWVNGAQTDDGAPGLYVGSKAFTESVILGEIAAQIIRENGMAAMHRRELGGTRVLWGALLKGEIDIYPEYTGTLRQEIFADQKITGRQGLVRALNAKGIGITAPLGLPGEHRNNNWQSAQTLSGTESKSGIKPLLASQAR
jgi:osmoprotectant transport system permease protein